MSPGHRLKPYIYLITSLTVVYLVVELGFNARLLDVTGSDATPAVVRSIEYWGRALSGTALSLAVWGTLLFPFASKRQWQPGVTLLAMLVSAACCITIMWQAQTNLISYVVDRSSGDARRTAAQLKLVERSAIERRVQISGIALTPDVMVEPEGKAFLSLLPFMASAIQDIGPKLETALRTIVREQVNEKMGGPRDFFDNYYRDSIDQVRQRYNQYVAACNSYADVEASIPARQREAWSTYVTALRDRGYSPNSVPGAGWSRVRTEVQEKGIPVPSDWRPDDERSFIIAVGRAITAKADSGYDDQMRDKLGVVLPKGLSFDEFEAQPVVQSRWHAALGLAGDARLSHQLNGQSFIDAVYRPLLDKATSEQIEKFADRDDDYSDGGVKEGLGRAAMTALVVPPIALLFSLAGALLHVFKVTNYIALILLAGVSRLSRASAYFIFSQVLDRWRTPVIALLTMALSFSAFLFPNAVTDSKFYGFVEEQMMQTDGIAPALSCRWIIQAQHYFWPLTERIRVRLLKGFAF